MIDGQLHNYIDSLNWSEGVTKHEQTHRAFLRAASLGVLASDAYKAVAGKVLESGGYLDTRGILRQCRRAYQHVTGKNSGRVFDGFVPQGDGSYAKLKRREFSLAKLKEMTAGFAGAISPQWFLERSPKQPRTAHEFLCELYPVGERVAILTKMNKRKPDLFWDHDVADVGAVSSDEGVYFQSNPVSGKRHLVERLKSETNPDGESWRCEEAVTAWRYMLLESDQEEKKHPGVGEGWLKFLAMLPAPIVSIVGSGKKSIHALVRVDADSKDDWDSKVRRLKEPLREIGADPGALTAVRLSRLPYCYRDGVEQQFYFCDPDATAVPIVDRCEGGHV